MEALNDHLPVELLLDHRIAIPAIVVRGRTIAAWNEAARELFHGDVGRPIDVLFDPRSRNKIDDALAAAPASCEAQTRRGEELVAARVAVIPFGPDARLLLIAPTGIEYSAAMAQHLLAANDHLANLTRELSRQSAELEAARARFESLADLREHFVSMLAHDVRGALHGIVLSADALEQAHEQGSDQVVRDALARTRHSAKRISDLVEKVLEAARTESGRMVLDAHPVSLSTVARDALEIYAPTAQEAGVRLDLIDRLGDATVSGDPVRLGQVVGNLLENAIRHSPAGGAVTVETTQMPEHVRLAVRDQGPGIPHELRARLFERFVQGASASGSLGLGLYVARQLVELHGGHILVEDVAPHGTAMVIEIPKRRSVVTAA